MREIETIQDLDEFLADTSRTPLFLLKHSTRCPVSTHALAQYRSFLGTVDEKGHAYLDIISFRDVSNEIEARTGVRHESPQAFLFDGGKVLWNDSHFGISAEALTEALSQQHG